MEISPVEEPREFLLDDGSRWLRTGHCSHCGWCCTECVLHDAVAMRCTGYGGATYYGFGCATWPDPSFRLKLPESCTYAFERVA